jgi:hypothetical protein
MLPKRTPPGTTASPAPAKIAGGGGFEPNKAGRFKNKPENKKDKKADTTMQKVKDWWADVLKQAQKK